MTVGRFKLVSGHQPLSDDLLYSDGDPRIVILQFTISLRTGKHISCGWRRVLERAHAPCPKCIVCLSKRYMQLRRTREPVSNVSLVRTGRDSSCRQGSNRTHRAASHLDKYMVDTLLMHSMNSNLLAWPLGRFFFLS